MSMRVIRHSADTFLGLVKVVAITEKSLISFPPVPGSLSNPVRVKTTPSAVRPRSGSVKSVVNSNSALLPRSRSVYTTVKLNSLSSVKLNTQLAKTGLKSSTSKTVTFSSNVAQSDGIPESHASITRKYSSVVSLSRGTAVLTWPLVESMAKVEELLLVESMSKAGELLLMA